MDCMTISTFRNLEQQAIRQYKELKTRKSDTKILLKETFGQEQPYSVKNLPYINNIMTNNKTTNKGINYYA